jgi:hypothetical protein
MAEVTDGTSYGMADHAVAVTEISPATVEQRRLWHRRTLASKKALMAFEVALRR